MFDRYVPITGCAVILLFSFAAAFDYPIIRPADSIHPGQEALRVTSLLERTPSGKRKLQVEDASGIDARQWLLVARSDGLLQETHCIKSVEGNEVKLSEKLRNTFEAPDARGPRTHLIQGSIVRERGIVANLVSPVSSGKKRLRVDSLREIDALEQIVIQSPDGRKREAHCVKTLKSEGAGFVAVTYSDLRSDFPSGSTLLQGAAIGGDLEREETICCCPGKAAGPR